MMQSINPFIEQNALSTTTLRVRFSEKAKQHIVSSVKEYFELLDTQCIALFLPQWYTYQIVDESEPADICIVGIQHTDNSLLRANEFNVLLSVENFSVGRRHYQHFNQWGKWGNPAIQYYIYNDEVTKSPQCSPAADLRVAYYTRVKMNPLYESIRSKTKFSQKKFCLFTSRNGLNINKNTAIKALSQLGRIDFLDQYEATHNIKSLTCYHDPVLLEIYNQYKFIICFENSKTAGYVTEKIFNVMMAGSIPIYDGAPNIEQYVPRGSYIHFDEQCVKKVSMIMKTPLLYEAILQKQ
jgi:hypothetical protein